MFLRDSNKGLVNVFALITLYLFYNTAGHLCSAVFLHQLMTTELEPDRSADFTEL